MSRCPWCGYAVGHEPLWLASVTVAPPRMVDTRETSRIALESIADGLNALQAEVAEFIARCGRQGATDEEIASGLKMNPSTVRPRRGELAAKKRIAVLVDAGGAPVKRPTRSGRPALVWVAAGEGAR